MAKVSVGFVGGGVKPTDRLAASLVKTETFAAQRDAIVGTLSGKISEAAFAGLNMHLVLDEIVEEHGKMVKRLKPGRVLKWSETVEALNGSHWIWLMKKPAVANLPPEIQSISRNPTPQMFSWSDWPQPSTQADLVHAVPIALAKEILEWRDGGVVATFKPNQSVDFPGLGGVVWFGLSTNDPYFDGRYGIVVIVIDPIQLEHYSIVGRLPARQYTRELSLPMLVEPASQEHPPQGFAAGTIPCVWPKGENVHAEVVVKPKAKVLKVRVREIRFAPHGTGEDFLCVRSLTRDRKCDCKPANHSQIQLEVNAIRMLVGQGCWQAAFEIHPALWDHVFLEVCAFDRRDRAKQFEKDINTPKSFADLMKTNVANFIAGKVFTFHLCLIAFKKGLPDEYQQQVSQWIKKAGAQYEPKEVRVLDMLKTLSNDQSLADFLVAKQQLVNAEKEKGSA